MGKKEVVARLESSRDDIIELERSLCAIPALSPEYEAPPEQTGEARKVSFLKDYLRQQKIEQLVEIEAKDDRVPEGVRPSLIARVKGKSPARTVWVMAHTDVVPPGDMEKWTSDPWDLQVRGDLLYGRGVEDNQQGLVASVMVARALVETETTPPCDLAILFVADEECGSVYGIQHVLREANPFKDGDIIIVPDGGAQDGSQIEVAEKSILWVKFQVMGAQCHGSMPAKGNNALRAGAHLLTRLDETLHREFPDHDPIFDPPESTFEPTKKERNVDAINIIPGEDTFYFDCRVLPRYPLEDVVAKIKEVLATVEEEFGVTVKISFEQKEEAAPPTSPDAPVVKLLQEAVQEVYGVQAGPIGIGGGTVAAYLRREGLPCVVWSRMDETMHAPNENANINNIIGDAKVIAHVLFSA